MRILRALVFAALLACVVGSQASAQQTAPDAAALRAIEDQVSAIRGLQPQAAPELRVLDHTSLNSYLSDEFASNYLPSEREADQKELAMLGLIQPTDDLVQIQLNLLNDQVIGIYDADAHSLFVVSDQQSFGPAARLTYAHEFDHALQDQYYGLRKIAPRHINTNDHSLAVHAVIEGDAIMLQTLWAVKNLTQDELAELVRASSSGTDDVLSRVPLITRTELLFPYTDGLNFVRQAYRQGGNSYAAVDGLFANPPESTAQILHPEKYRNHVHPINMALELAPGLGADWRAVGSGALGELDTRVLLEQWGATHSDASRVAAGWAGDRWQLVERDGHDAIALKSTWASPTAAGDFFDALTAGLRTHLDTAEVLESSGTRQALDVAGRSTDVRLQDSTVLVIIAADRATADAVVDAATVSAL